MSVWGRVQNQSDSNTPLPTTFDTRARILLHSIDSPSPQMDLEASGCLCDEDIFREEIRGWKIYRAEWIPRLYPFGQEPDEREATPEDTAG